MFKYGVFYGPYFPALIPSTGKYGPEKTLSLDTFHAVYLILDGSHFHPHFQSSIQVYI